MLCDYLKHPVQKWVNPLMYNAPQMVRHTLKILQHLLIILGPYVLKG